MAKKIEPKVAHGWATPIDEGQGSFFTGVVPTYVDEGYRADLLPRARYRALLAAERERDALRDDVARLDMKLQHFLDKAQVSETGSL